MIQVSERLAIRNMVRGTYDLQKHRIQFGNRIVGNFKVKLGQEPGKPEETISAEDQKLLDKLRQEFKKITDGVTNMSKHSKWTFVADGIISHDAELAMLETCFRLEDDEEVSFKRVKRIIERHPIWTSFLVNVKGCGPAMSGVLISEIDITKARYPSSLWKYAGLDTGPDGKGRSRKAEHLATVPYTNKDGEPAERQSITFNPFLKTKLTGVLAPCFLKANSQPYRDIYDAYKHRLENHEQYGEDSKGHRHNMAIRYMVKRFLVDLYTAWRPLEGLPVAPEYSVAKLGLVHQTV